MGSELICAPGQRLAGAADRLQAQQKSIRSLIAG